MSEHMTHYEIAHWRSRTGGDVLFVRPTRAIASQIRNRNDFFDTEIAASTYTMARELGHRCVERFDRRHPDSATTLRVA